MEVASIAGNGQSATVQLSTLSDLGIDLTSAKKQNFVLRSVIKDVDGNIINQSLEAKFAITPAKITG